MPEQEQRMLKQENKIGLEVGRQKYRLFMARDVSFPRHIHRNYEMMIALDGQVKTVISGREYQLNAGECAVIFPLQEHQFSIGKDAIVKICLFSTDLVPEFDMEVHGKVPVNPIFKPDNSVLSVPDAKNPLAVKAFFYHLCLQIAEKLPLEESHRTLVRNSAIEKVLLFVDENYQENCDLKTVAKVLKYDYTYLSKLFKSHTGIPYNEYLNQFRINRAGYLLTEQETDITEISENVGYSSVRTFNRAFLQVMGVPPSQYRKKLKIQ